MLSPPLGRRTEPEALKLGNILGTMLTTRTNPMSTLTGSLVRLLLAKANIGFSLPHSLLIPRKYKLVTSHNKPNAVDPCSDPYIHSQKSSLIHIYMLQNNAQTLYVYMLYTNLKDPNPYNPFLCCLCRSYAA